MADGASRFCAGRNSGKVERGWWTPARVHMLTSRWGSEPPHYIARDLQTTVEVVRQKAQTLGLPPPRVGAHASVAHHKGAVAAHESGFKPGVACCPYREYVRGDAETPGRIVPCGTQVRRRKPEDSQYCEPHRAKVMGGARSLWRGGPGASVILGGGRSPTRGGSI